MLSASATGRGLSVGTASVGGMTTTDPPGELGGITPDEAPVLRALRAAVAAVIEAAAGGMWRLSEPELGQAVSVAQRLHALVDLTMVRVLSEAESRGTGSEDGWTRVDWALRHAPDLTAADAATLTTVARASSDRSLEQVTGAFSSGELTVSKAAALVRFAHEARPLAEPADLTEKLDILTGAAPALTDKQLALAIRRTSTLLRSDEAFERDEDRQRAARSLRKGPGPAGMSRYHLLLDPEGSAILDAAIDPLAGPVPGDGQPDLRSAATRRADALLAIIGRGVSAPGTAPRTARTTLLVTIAHDQLVAGLANHAPAVPIGQPATVGRDPARVWAPQGARVVTGAGTTASGELLSAGTIRRLACDADVIPAVLGSRSELLDLGRRTRLFTPGQRAALWIRDKQCTYPGCTVPAPWTEAHHITPWFQDGTTDLHNAALLCGRHHTLVHRRRLSATATDMSVTWGLAG
jgi:hypothetical protein